MIKAFTNGGGVKMMKLSDLQNKEVVNIVDGKKLGQISDLELDLNQGVIESITVPDRSRFFFGLFRGGADVVIPWHDVVKIGLDVVLVKLEDAQMYGIRDRFDAYPDFQRAYKS